MVKAWDSTLIGDFLEFKNGLNKGKEFFGHGTPIVNYTDVYQKRGLKASDIRGRVFLTADEIHRFKVRKYDVFFTRTSETPDEVGMTSVLLEDIDDCVFSGFVLRGRPKNDMFVPEYCKYCFSTAAVRNAIITGCTYTTRALTNGKQLSAIEISLPPKPEQEAIATALSDIDALITNLEKLIAKKKAIKQGAMQELLTGKRRLPGFGGEWAERGLDECCYRIGVGLATSVTQYYRPDGTVIFRNLNIKPNYLDDKDILFLDNDFATQNPSKIVHTGDVLTVHTGYVGISCVVPPKYDGALTFTTLISTTKPQMLIPEYLSYHLNSELGHAEVENLQAGGGRNNLNVADFKQYKMRIPSDISEQKAIVAFLKDLDSDLDALQKKFDKLTRIKSGMMSELLTGRIRLV